VAFAQLQPPSPSLPKRNNQQKQPSTDIQDSASNNQRGTDESPIVVKVLPSAQADKEPPKGQSKDSNQTTDWWMFGATMVIAIIGAIQTRVFWIQAQRLKETIEKMEEISGKQTADIRASLAQTTRATEAMQDIATSMAINVKSVQESVAINREIADRQRLITELQSRPYLTLTFELMVPQDLSPGVRFEPRLRIENRGNTPAYNITYSIVADICPMPVPSDFAFALPDKTIGHSSIIAPLLHKIIGAVVPEHYDSTEAHSICEGIQRRVIAWGIVNYRDAFGIDRFIRFGFTFYQQGQQGAWFSQDTSMHNDSN
jgi:hypothetical protein